MSEESAAARTDIVGLFDLARQKSREGRAQLYEDIWNLFEAEGETLTDSERRLMTDILRRLSHDVEMSVRVHLSEKLLEQETPQPELASMLANDQIEVAYPILLNCKALRDADLIEVVRHRTLQHQLATAMRDNISNAVSEALVDTGQEDVVEALLQNSTAQISEALMEHLVAESERVDRYQKPLLRRPDLPKALAKRMYAWVSAALRTFILENYQLDPSELDDSMSVAMRAAVTESTGETEPRDPSERLVQKLHAAGQLNIAFAVKALRQGEIGLFEFTVAKLADMRPALMRRMIYEPGGEALAIACHALEVDRQVFLTIYELTRVARGMLARQIATDRARLQVFYDGLHRPDSLTVLRRWRQDPDYLAALNNIGK